MPFLLPLLGAIGSGVAAAAPAVGGALLTGAKALGTGALAAGKAAAGPLAAAGKGAIGMAPSGAGAGLPLIGGGTAVGAAPSAGAMLANSLGGMIGSNVLQQGLTPQAQPGPPQIAQMPPAPGGGGGQNIDQILGALLQAMQQGGQR